MNYAKFFKILGCALLINETFLTTKVKKAVLPENTEGLVVNKTAEKAETLMLNLQEQSRADWDYLILQQTKHFASPANKSYCQLIVQGSFFKILVTAQRYENLFSIEQIIPEKKQKSIFVNKDDLGKVVSTIIVEIESEMKTSLQIDQANQLKDIQATDQTMSPPAQPVAESTPEDQIDKSNSQEPLGQDLVEEKDVKQEKIAKTGKKPSNTLSYCPKSKDEFYNLLKRSKDGFFEKRNVSYAQICGICIALIVVANIRFK